MKLADFGVSQNMSVSGGDDDALTPMGTPFYMAPEVIQFMGAQPQSDVWSLGCTIIELLKVRTHTHRERERERQREREQITVGMMLSSLLSLASYLFASLGRSSLFRSHTV